MSGEVILLFAIIVGSLVLVEAFDRPPRNKARYSGPVYDPAPRLFHRAGAVGYTGRKCPLCGATTFGQSLRCGACGRLNVKAPIIPTESTRRKSLVERDEVAS